MYLKLKEVLSPSLIWHIYRIAWSGFLRLLWGEDWLNKLLKFPKINKIRSLPKNRFHYYYVRDIGRGLVQSKLPDGSILQPFDDIEINAEIYRQEAYDGFRKIQKDDVIIDVGAHIGLFALKAAKKAKNGIVIAIEPHPFNYKLLRRNMVINGVRNVIPVKLALSDFSGTTKLCISKQSSGHTISAKRKEMSERITETYLEVEVKTLDQLINELELDRVDFIKIDAEGAELEILRGAERTLKGNDVFVTVACYHIPQEDRNVNRYLKKISFRVYSSPKHEYLYGLRDL